jgi:hypothetical protein
VLHLIFLSFLFIVSTSTAADQTVSRRELHENEYFGEERLMQRVLAKAPFRLIVKPPYID